MPACTEQAARLRTGWFTSTADPSLEPPPVAYSDVDAAWLHILTMYNDADARRTEVQDGDVVRRIYAEKDRRAICDRTQELGVGGGALTVPETMGMRKEKVVAATGLSRAALMGTPLPKAQSGERSSSPRTWPRRARGGGS